MREFALTFAVGALVILFGSAVVWIFARWPLLLLITCGIAFVHDVGGLALWFMEDTW